MMQLAIATLGDDYHTGASTRAHKIIILILYTASFTKQHVASEGL